MGRGENAIETHLDEQVVKLGGLTRKWVSPGRSGVPDRIVILNGAVWFVEVKQLGEEPEPHQLREMRRLMGVGANVTWVAGLAAVDKFLENIT